MGARTCKQAGDLTPPTPLPCEGRGESGEFGEFEESEEFEESGESFSPLLAGEGLGERSFLQFAFWRIWRLVAIAWLASVHCPIF